MTSTGNNQSCVEPNTQLGEKRKATPGRSNNWKSRKVCAVRTMPKPLGQSTTNHVTSEGKLQHNSATIMGKQNKTKLQSQPMEHSSEEVNKPWDEQPPKLKFRTSLKQRILMATHEFPKAFEKLDEKDYGLEPIEYDYIPLPSDSLESDSSDNEESSDKKSTSFDEETSSDAWIRNCKRRVLPDLRCSQPGHETSKRADPEEVLGDPDDHFLSCWGYSSEDEPVEYFTGSYNEDYLTKAHSSEEYLDSFENDTEKSFDSVDSCAARDEEESVENRSTDIVDHENSMDNDSSEVISQPNFGNQSYVGIKESIYTPATSFAADYGAIEEHVSVKSQSTFEPERTFIVEPSDNLEAADACDNHEITIEHEESFWVVGADVRDQDATLKNKSSFSIGSIGRFVSSDANHDIIIKHNVSVTIKPRSNFGNPGVTDDQ